MKALTQPIPASTDAATLTRSQLLVQTSTLLQVISLNGLVYGLTIVIGWIGAMKFTAMEASAIEPFVRHSPFLSFFYAFCSVQSFSNGLGVVEILIAILIAAHPMSKQASALGGLLGVGMFLTTLSFMLTTPGVWADGLGFPALGSAGQFLVKDLVLLAGSAAVLADSLKALTSPR